METQIYRARRQFITQPPAEVLLGSPWSPAPEQLELIDDPISPEGDEVRLDHELLEQLLAAGLERGHANDTSDEYALDRWLAPRLHGAMRIPRRVASETGFWAWIAMKYGARYMSSRFAKDGAIPGWRFTGTAFRNGVSRLWWAAELLRDGPDYSRVDRGLRRVRSAQFALELRYSWYRPAALAFVEVAESADDRPTDDELSALSRRANAYLPLAPLEAIGFDEGAAGMDFDWWGGACTLEDLVGDESPVGPKDQFADAVAVKSLVSWYREVLAEDHDGQS